MRAPALLIVIFLQFISSSATAARLTEYHILSSGLDRVFYLHIPAGSSAGKPVLMAFHGGGGTALNAEKQFDFSRLADQYGYILVCPQGINKQWNDGRLAPALGEANNDVQFIRDILSQLAVLAPSCDTTSLFCTGISNGGFFSIYLACRLNSIVKAVAPVCASIPRDLEHSFTLNQPVPLMLIAGTADPLVKYEGGWIGFRNRDAGRGYSMPIDWTLKRWIALSGCNSNPVIETMPDTDKTDGCSCTKYSYSKDGKAFIGFIKVQNGGHAWPGGLQNLPPWMVGKLCKDFSASEMIIGFFNNFRKKE